MGSWCHMAANGTSGWPEVSYELTARANTSWINEVWIQNAVYAYAHIDWWTTEGYDSVWYRYAALVSVSFQDWVHSTQAPKSHSVFTAVQCANSWHLLSTAGWCGRSSALRCLWPNSSHHACLPWIICFLLLRAGGLVLNFLFNCTESVDSQISSGRSSSNSSLDMQVIPV